MRRRPSTAPTAWPIAATPRTSRRDRCTWAWMRARSFSGRPPTSAASSSAGIAHGLDLMVISAEENAARLPALLTILMMIFILPTLFIGLLGTAAIIVLDSFARH